ncbi:MAG: C10 family peptidase [Candidatus Marinimicrobia bacterium]|nr:C10 family peptidase [Candidatus Neomarinimicrobiota bacterium]
MRGSHSRIGLILALVAGLGTGVASGAPVSEREALARFSAWARGHPVMAAVADRPVAAVTRFPDDSAAYGVYVIVLAPGGYALLSGDDRLPPVVGYSAWATIRLTDRPDNVFRRMLARHVERAAARLADMSDDEPAWSPAARTTETGVLSVVQYGPYLDTSWDQCHPYNLECPDDPDGTVDFGFRAPTGCTPTAYAQVMQFHRWPLRGLGAHSYTDAAGSITGFHEADFSTAFGWSAMQPAYSAYSATQPGDEEVGDLMYRLGVAAEANYESSGTSSSIEELGQRLADNLYYEGVSYHASQSALLPALDADLQAGFPAVVSIPGHAIVADGLLLDGADKAYHINYGWGGVNNGWWGADDVAGYPLSSGCTGIRPSLLPMPVALAAAGVAGQPIELRWLLPKRRESEAKRLRIQALTLQGGPWAHAAETLEHTVSRAWETRAEGRTGNCWYAGPNGSAVLTVTDQLVPAIGATLDFWMQYRLGSATLNVSVSTDGGQTFTVLAAYNNAVTLTWQAHAISLDAYAGQPILLRFELTSGSYYDSGGVWLDDLSLSAGTWYRWAPFAEDAELAARRFSEERTLWDPGDDFSLFEVTSTSTYMDWALAATGDGGSCFYKEAGGYGNRAYHLTAIEPITPQANTRLLLRWKRLLAEDSFRVLVSTDRATFTEIWSALGESDWTEQAIPLSDYAGQSIYVRLEYVVGAYLPSGGVWIDALHLQTVTNAEFEGQPEHYTLLDDISPGRYTLAALVVAQDDVPQARGPTFILDVYPLYETVAAGEGVIITAYHGATAHVVVPAEMDGQPVVGLGAGAFTDPSLISLVLPGGLTDIAAGAFAVGVTPQRVYFLGAAPDVASGALRDTGAIVYYRLGPAGWGSTLDGRPTVQWNAVLSFPAATGMTPDGFTLLITGPADHVARIECQDDLALLDWTPLASRVLTDGAGSFTDPEALAAPQRAYRVRVPPLE